VHGFTFLIVDKVPQKTEVLALGVASVLKVINILFNF